MGKNPYSPEQLRVLHQQYTDEIDPEKKKKKLQNLVKIYSNLVRKRSHTFLSKCAEPFDDLFQLGCVGLIKALNRYDPKARNVFSSYAVLYIDGEIQHFLRDHAAIAKIPRGWHETHAKINTLSRKNPNWGEAEIAQALAIPKSSVVEIKHAAAMSRGCTKELPETLLCSESSKFDYAFAKDYLNAIAFNTDILLSKLQVPDRNLLEQFFSQGIEGMAKKESTPQMFLVMQIHQVLCQLAALDHSGQPESF
jgi:RNA polymerase sigma factor (sigma-70 family)